MTGFWGRLSAVKNPLAIQETQETWVQSLGSEDFHGGGRGDPLQCYCMENCHEQRILTGCSP